MGKEIVVSKLHSDTVTHRYVQIVLLTYTGHPCTVKNGTKAPANEAIGNMGKAYQPPVTAEEAFLSWTP